MIDFFYLNNPHALLTIALGILDRSRDSTPGYRRTRINYVFYSAVESELSYTDSPSAPSGALQAMKEARQPSNKKDGKGKDIRKNNSLAPFATLGKPTCGFFFADSTNNRKAKFGIPPSDLVKWRNIPSQ